MRIYFLCCVYYHAIDNIFKHVIMKQYKDGDDDWEIENDSKGG